MAKPAPSKGRRNVDAEAFDRALQVLGVTLDAAQLDVERLRQLYADADADADAANTTLRAARETASADFQRAAAMRVEADGIERAARFLVEGSREDAQETAQRAARVRELRIELSAAGCTLPVAQLPVEPPTPPTLVRALRKCTVACRERAEGEVFECSSLPSARYVEPASATVRVLDGGTVMYGGKHYSPGDLIEHFIGQLEQVEVVSVDAVPQKPDLNGRVFANPLDYMAAASGQETVAPTAVADALDDAPPDVELQPAEQLDPDLFADQ